MAQSVRNLGIRSNAEVVDDAEDDIATPLVDEMQLTISEQRNERVRLNNIVKDSLVMLGTLIGEDLPMLVLNLSMVLTYSDYATNMVQISLLLNGVLLGSRAPQLMKLRDAAQQRASLETELARKEVALEIVQERRKSFRDGQQQRAV